VRGAQSRGCAVSQELVSRPPKTAAQPPRKQQLANRHTVYRGKTWGNQPIGKSISNYKTYIQGRYKYINLKLIDIDENNNKYFILIILIIINKIISGNKVSFSQARQQIIISVFNKHTGHREKSFTVNYFKRLLLNFIINNNISFRAVTTPSFKQLLEYLN
jgi:hypothetical protein